MTKYELEKENERLQKAIKVQEIMLGNQDRAIKKAKAEAIKEFWNNRPERLNEQCKGKEEFHKGWNACLDEFWDIRNHLLKEMEVEA